MAAPAVSGPESVDAYGTNDDSITGLVDGSGVTVIPLSELIDSRPPDWEAVWRRPKDDFGDFHFRAGWYKTLRQNENGHTTPDWKLHISVELPYVTAAWKLMSALFIDMHGDFGIKATCQADPTLWGSQRGREITVYMFVYDPKYPIEEDPSLSLDPIYERVYNRAFWRHFIAAAEEVLIRAGIPTNGCADGDFPLTPHVSIRNEAFVDDMYPPNARGHNAAGHPDVFGLCSPVVADAEQ